jgi:hypothetical protein
VLNDDRDRMRSEIITVSQTSLDVEGDKYKFGYYLEGSHPRPSQVQVTVYGSPADKFAVLYGTLEGTRYGGWNYVYFPQDIIPTGGVFYVVVSGLDDNLNNKKHSRAPLLERGTTGIKVSASIFAWEEVAEAGEKTDEELAKGAFYFTTDQDNHPYFFERAIKFAQEWRKWGSSEKYPRLVGVGTSELGAAALKSVDVWVFYGHGRGWSVQFGEAATYGGIITKGSPPSDYTYNPKYIYLGDKNIFPLPLSNLDLVVVACCIDTAGSGSFPFLQEIVNMGAKCGIGITGKEIKYTPDKHTIITMGILYPPQYIMWAEKFWKYATDGYVVNGQKVYPTVQQAAIVAVNELNNQITISPDVTISGPPLYAWDDNQGHHELYFLPPFIYGKDGYLGNMVIR